MDIGKGNIRVVPIAMTAILTLSLLSGLGIFDVTNVAIAKTISEMATNQIAESNLNIAYEASYAAEFLELNISISKQELLIEDYTVPITRGCDFKWYGDGVWSEYPEYEPYDDFIDYSQFANYADGCNYTAYFYEYAPDGTLIWTDSRFDWLPGGCYVTWTITVHSPTAGWEIGDFKFCSEVMPDDCGALPAKCCNNTVMLGGVQDINVTPEHLDFECCEEVYSLNAGITLKNSSDIRCTHSAHISNLNETNHIIWNVSNNLSEPERSLCGCNKAEGEVIGIKNPAAVYCMDMGYEYKIEKTESGEQGICVMPDKEECDAWAFYRGECGRECSYCAKKGWPIALKGKADCFAIKSTTCVLPDGSRKTVSELLNLSDKCTVGVKKSAGTNLNNGNIESRDTDLPDHFNWRDKNGRDWMTPVKNQGSCGSCWAFSAVGVVEPQYNIFMKNPDLDLDLSEEYLVSDCYNAGSCCGGWHYEAINFTKDSGIPDEACLPYVDGTGCSCYGDTCDSNCNYRTGGACSDTTCSDRCSNWSTRLKYINETGSVPNDIETIKDYLIEKGPLSVAIGMGSDFGGSFDGNGIYRCSNDSCVNHAVVITGYNETDDYWIVKNSWGSGWIDEGYFKVGYGECAIETMVYYANHTDGVNCKAFTVFNEGDGYLVVDDIEIHYQTGEPTGWLDVNPNSFTVSPSGSELVGVCVDCIGLFPDEYHGWLNIRSNDPDEDPYQVSVTLCVNGPWVDDPNNQCKERRLRCSGSYEYRNKPDGTICGYGEWEDDPDNLCKERRKIHKCVEGTCTPSGEYERQNKLDGTICGCTTNNTLKECYEGACSDTGICNATICNADIACDGKNPGESCGTNRKCNVSCKCQDIEVPPHLVTYTITNRTITPPQTTEIDVAFSETVSWIIAIEGSSVIYDWTWTSINPAPKVWDGTYEVNGTQVPDGIYRVNIAGTNTTTGLRVVNNTETIMVTSAASVLTSIEVAPATATPNVGDTEQFTATAYDQFGNEMAYVIFTWTSSNTTVGIIDNSGYFTALAAGTTTINAANGSIAGSAFVTVGSAGIAGDINGDGEVDYRDGPFLVKHVLGIPGYETIHADGDVNCDGVVDYRDGPFLVKHVLGIPGYEHIC